MLLGPSIDRHTTSKGNSLEAGIEKVFNAIPDLLHRLYQMTVIEVSIPSGRLHIGMVKQTPDHRQGFLVHSLAARDCKAMLTVFENHMKDRRFAVGDKQTVADFNAAYTLD